MYYLGVDGGNTKTDFALMRADGTLIDWIRVGTCSHETLPGGYAAAAQDVYKRQPPSRRRLKIRCCRHPTVSSPLISHGGLRKPVCA